MRNLNQISLFSKLANSSQKVCDITVEQAINAIRSGKLNISGSIIDIKATTQAARKLTKGSDAYKNYKKYNIPAVTWASSFTTGRNKTNGYTFSGAVYFDIDDTELSPAEVKAAVSTISCVKAVWTSVSGKGIGGIFYAETESVEHYAAFVAKVEALGFTTDKSVKDVTSRTNVLSYDPSAFVRQDSDVEVLTETVSEVSLRLSSNITRTFDKNIVAVSGSDAHKIAYNYVVSHGISHTEGSHCAFVTRYAGLMNQFGVEFNDMCTELAREVGSFNVQRASDIYNRYAFQFNTKSTKPTEYRSKQADSVRTIKAGQTLSDTGLVKADVIGKMLVAPTGTGKTYFVTKLEGKKVIVVPGQKLSDELANSYNGVVFNQYNKEVSNQDNLIFVTYASYTNLLSKISISEYDVFIDEAHNFTTSASRTFMFKELDAVISSLIEGKQKSVTLLTATPIRSAHPFLAAFEQVVVTSEVAKNKEFVICKTTNRVKLLQDTFAKAKAENKFVAVLLNNTKDLLDSYTSALSQYNLQVFNATKKSEDYFVELINTGNIDSTVDGFFSTTVIKEGNSLKLDGKSEVVVVVIGRFGADEIEQFSARFRNATKVTVLVVRSADYTSKNNYFDGFRDEADLIEAASFNAKYFNDCKFSSNQYSINLTKTLDSIQETFVKSNLIGEYEVDYLTISNFIYEKEKSAAWNNTEFFTRKLAGYGWKFNGEVDYTVDLTDVEKQALSATNKATKAAKQAQADKIVAQVKAEGLIENSKIVDANKDLPAIEATIRYRLNYIHKYESNTDKVFEVYAKVSATTQSWNTFEKQVMVAKVKTDSSIKDRDDRKVVDAITAAFKVGEVLTNAEITARVKTAVASVTKYKSLDVINERKANQILGWFFGIADKVVKVNGQNVRKYEITSANPLELNINTDQYIAEREGTVPTHGVRAEKIMYNFGLFA